MIRPAFLPLILCVQCVFLLICLEQAFGDMSDCVWGGSNEETTYSPTFVPGMGGVTLAQYQPPMNLGAPPAPSGQAASIPIQATPNTQPLNVPQANIPTITIPAGPVGSVGQPATILPGTPLAAVPLQDASASGEIVYIMPASLPSNAEICIDGVKTVPASEVKVVPANTPGAIPVALKTVTVRRPKVEYHWAYDHIENKTETLVQVVNPRTGQVARTYCHEDSRRSILPWLHRREVITYETVEAKVAVPVSVAPSVSSSSNTVILGGIP